MRRALTIGCMGVLLAISAGFVEARAPEPSGPPPINANASPEVRALLRYLQSLSGRYTLSGQHNYPYTIARWTDRAYGFTGRYPALFGQDFGFEAGLDKDSIEARPELVAEVIRQHRKGALVTLTWHAVRPTDDEPVTFRNSVQGRLSDFEWRELLRPGSSLHSRWCEQVDVIAGYLRELKRARVPVLWRPYHEVNGSWFWWGGRKGRDGSAALYRQLYERLTQHHRLDNLVWVWNANASGDGSNGPGPFADYFPGTEYADVLSVDNYGPYEQRQYDDILALAGGKPIALGEVGRAPTAALLREQPRWSWFMIWSEILESANTEESVRELFSAPNVANRDDPRVAKPMAAIRVAAAPPEVAPVTPEASAETRAALARLREVSGRRTLAGQDHDLVARDGAIRSVAEITGRHPAIFGHELATPSKSGQEPAAFRLRIAEEAERQHREGALVTLSWQPARPTEDELGAADDSARGVLTDFEWNELLTPGTRLEERWRRQTDAMASTLRRLADAGVPVLFRPYPRANAKGYWWSDRKGRRGSAALYRRLFERLVDHHGLRNLVWVWGAAEPGGPDGPGPYGDFFPGHDCVDALAVDLEEESPRWDLDARLAIFGVGKPIGLGLPGAIPAADVFSRQGWAWFQVAAPSAPLVERDAALRRLYADPRVVSRPAASGPDAGAHAAP